MTQLYVLAAGYADLQQAAEEGVDVSDRLAALDDAIEAKGAALAAVLRGIDADAEAMRAEEKRIAERRHAIEANGKRIERYVRSCMESAGITKIKSGTFSITLSAGALSVQVLDESAVPETYVRVKREVNKTAVLSAYRECGEIVPGCDIVQSTTLRIR